MPGASGRRSPLLDLDAGFRDGYGSGGDAASMTVPRFSFGRGAEWPDAGSAALLLDGLVLRRASLGRRPMAQLLGPGDLVSTQPVDTILPVGIEVVTVRTGSAALLDAEFRAAAQDRPHVLDELARRGRQQEQRMVLQLSIMALPRVEQRLLALLWHLAELFGRMTLDGARVDVDLPHEMLGQMIGAARPTVSLASSALHEQGLARRGADRSWTLAPDGLDALGGRWPPGRPAIGS